MTSWCASCSEPRRRASNSHRLADAARLVDRDLLADRQVHRQVQERVRAAVLDRVARRQRGRRRRPGRRGTRGARRSTCAAMASIGVSGRPGVLLAPRCRRRSGARRAGRAGTSRQLCGPPTEVPMKVTTEQLFTDARTQNGYLGRPGLRRHAARALRPAEVGPDLGQLHARRASSSCAAPRPRTRLIDCVIPGNVQQGARGAGDRGHRHGHGVLRQAAAAVPAHRRARLVRRQAGE